MTAPEGSTQSPPWRQQAAAPSGQTAPRAPALPALAVALLAGAFSFAGIGSHSLWTPDEPRDAAVGKAMAASGDYVVPRLNGQPFLEKPPFYWWVQAASFKLLGASDATARVPSALFATLALLATYAFGRRLGGERLGLLAAGVLASCAEFGEDMGRVLVDPALVFLVGVAYFGFAALAAPRPDWAAAERRWAILAVAAAAPLAFLTKGVAGLGLALGPPLLYLALARPSSGGRAARWRLLAPLAAVGLPLFAAIALPWAWALVREAGWPALRECLIGNTVGRLLSTEAGRAYGHRQPFWYYLTAGAPALLPWTLALPALLRASRAGRAPSMGALAPEPQAAAAGAGGGEASVGGGEASAEARHLLLACCGIGVLLLSVAASKRTLYLVPLLPALAINVAWWLAGLRQDGPPAPERRWDRATALLLLALAAVLPALLWLAALGLRWAPPDSLARVLPTLPTLQTLRTLRTSALQAGLDAPRLAAGGLAALAASGLLLARLLAHLRRRTLPAAAWLLVPYLALLVVYQTAVKAAVDPIKNLHDLTAAIARLSPPPVFAYQPSEAALGIIGFDLGWAVVPIADPRQLAELLASHPAARVVVTLDALGRLPPELRRQLVLLYDESGLKASPYAVVTMGSPTSTTSPARPGTRPINTSRTGA
ncbi:MAG TPA: glycosyltransferase family 39 protein [Thermoanaerobaculia bacterium]|nr:glycosyltransferase family 39 protein [Thermoanaerobaculia bacterium]